MIIESPHLAATLERIATIKERFAPLSAKRNYFKQTLSSSYQKSVCSPKPLNPELEKSIEVNAKEQNLEPALVKAIIQAESGFNARAVSRRGAQGLMQLMPGTSTALGVDNPFDPQQNIAGGCKYLRQMLDSFGGDLQLALGAYNAGPGAINKYNGLPPYAETQGYVNQVLELFDAYRANSSGQD